MSKISISGGGGNVAKNIKSGYIGIDNIARKIWPVITPGSNWEIKSTPKNIWRSVCYGNGLFVAVGYDSVAPLTSNVMTSPDGINWTVRTGAAPGVWDNIIYANGLFVATGFNGPADNIMISSNGINWISKGSGSITSLYPIAYGNGLFVIGSTSAGAVVTSPDGNTWTRREVTGSGSGNVGNSMCFGNGKFVSVGTSFSRTSTNGINWEVHTAPNYAWRSICYGKGKFVALSNTGTGNRAMTSSDGVNWTLQSTPVDNNWSSVCYGNDTFTAVAVSGEGNRAMTSSDGVNWKIQSTPIDNNWFSVTYGDNKFVAVAYDGNGVMISS